MRSRHHTPRSGFTLIELAICLSILSILVPLVYGYALNIEDRSVIGHWHLRTADEVRTLAESIRADKQQGVPDAEAVSFSMGTCTVTYPLEEGVLSRVDSCGSRQVIATGVSEITRQPSGVRVVFAQALRADRAEQQAVFIAMEER